MNSEQFVLARNEVIRKIYSQSMEVTLQHKMASGERIFKLIFNLSTLSLTAWVAIVAWKFEPFKIYKNYVYLSCCLFIIALLLVSLSELSVVIQSGINESILSKYQTRWLQTELQIDSSLIDHDPTNIQKSKEILDHHWNTTKDFLTKLHETTAGQSIWLKRMYWSSWTCGILGIITFFIASFLSIFTLTSYLSVV